MASPKSPSPLFKRFRLDWIIQFLIGLLFLIIAIGNWTSTDASFVGPSPLFTVLFLFLIISFGIAYQRLRLGGAWSGIMQLAGSDEPRDERESYLLGKASQYTFGATYLLTIILIATILLMPAPSKAGLYLLVLSFAMIQVSLRGMIAWFLGIR